MCLRSSRAPRAADSNTLWVDPSADNGIPSQIRVLQKGLASYGTSGASTTDFQLFLPGNANLSACYLSWAGDKPVTVDGVAYASGTCPIPAVGTTKTYTLANGTIMRITTYQGSPSVQPVFIVIDESGSNPTIKQMNSDYNHETTCTGDICIDGTWYEMPKI